MMTSANSSQSLLITGITSGIGHELLKLCLAKQYHVTGLVRLAEQKEMFADIGRKDLKLYAANLADKDQVDQVIQEVKINDFNYVVMNAGCALTGQFHEQPVDKIDEMMEANVLSNMRLVHAFLKANPNRSTKFIFVSSLAARLPANKFATYATSKAALSKFANSLCREYPHTQFLTVEIGAVDTPLHDKAGNIVPSKKGFKSPVVIAQRLLHAIERKTGVVTLSWDWYLIRKLALCTDELLTNIMVKKGKS